MGGVRVGLCSCGGGGGGDEWGFKNVDFFMGGVQFALCYWEGGGGVKIKFQEQGGDFVWVFCGGRRWSRIENLWP